MKIKEQEEERMEVEVSYMIMKESLKFKWGDQYYWVKDIKRWSIEDCGVVEILDFDGHCTGLMCRDYGEACNLGKLIFGLKGLYEQSFRKKNVEFS